MSTYKIYTDGGAQPNDPTNSIGAYAIAVIDSQNHVCETHCEGKLNVTNNQMELEAMLLALQYAKNLPEEQFEIITDSRYVLNGLTTWVHNWKRSGWIGANKQPVKNQELWQELAALQEQVSNVTISWVKGHSVHVHNNQVDQLCNLKIRNIRQYGLSPQS